MSHPKWKKVPVFKILKSSGFLSSPMLPILSWKQKIIANIDSSTISTAFKLELVCQYRISSWHYIVPWFDIRLWFVWFLCKALSKRLNFSEVDIYMSTWHSKSKRRAPKQDVKFVQNQQLRHQTKVNYFFLVLLLLTLITFYILL